MSLLVRETIRLSDISLAEQHVCERLGLLLQEKVVGDLLGDEVTERDLMASFEYFIPQVLREIHEEWRWESLDGVLPKYFRKTGEREAELLGLVIFISDQTIAPVHFRLQISPTFDCVSWLQLRLGERLADGCRREQYEEFNARSLMFHRVDHFESIEWFYHVSYGERET